MNVEGALAKVAERDPRPSHLGCRRASQGFCFPRIVIRGLPLYSVALAAYSTTPICHIGEVPCISKDIRELFFCSLTDEGAGNTGAGLKLMSAS